MKSFLHRLAPVIVTLVVVAAPLAAAAAPVEVEQSFLVGLRADGDAPGLARAGVKVRHAWAELQAANIIASPSEAARVARLPFVAYVEPDAPVTAMGPAVVDAADTWGLQAVRVPEARAAYPAVTGGGIRVCVLDSGIVYEHPEFQRGSGSIVKASKNFVADGQADARDGNGHGTHVAGTIAGGTTLSGSRIGVAPNVDLYVARVLNNNGAGTVSSIVNAVNWCVSSAVNAKIISASVGHGGTSITENSAFSSAYTKGALSFAAAGNGGNSAVSYPAGYSSVISVGAVDPGLAWATLSQFNSDVELAAPGVATLSSVPLGTGRQGAVSENGVAFLAGLVDPAPAGAVGGPLVECGLADSVTSCAGAPGPDVPWIALISRGNIDFRDKVANVMAQGADAAIIANNDAAHPDVVPTFLIGSGTWIPAVAVSYAAGVTIRADGLAAGQVSVVQGNYTRYDGTSMATPHAAGVAALAWSARPALTNAKLRTVLQTTAKNLGAAGRDVYYGYGLIQADAAIQGALAAK